MSSLLVIAFLSSLAWKNVWDLSDSILKMIWILDVLSVGVNIALRVVKVEMMRVFGQYFICHLRWSDSNLPSFIFSVFCKSFSWKHSIWITAAFKFTDRSLKLNNFIIISESYNWLELLFFIRGGISSSMVLLVKTSFFIVVSLLYWFLFSLELLQSFSTFTHFNFCNNWFLELW